MDKNRNLYNAMEAIKRITGYKDQWHSTDDKATADSVAKKAQVYYKMLADSGYADIADALSKTDNVGAKKIYDDFMKNNSVPSTPTTTTTTTPTDTSNGVETVKFQMPEAPADVDTVNGKINHMWGVQGSNMGTLLGKYDTLEEYIYGNPFERDEGKSIMTNYQFKGKTASDNAVASGGASNGGNIDSYAAANANRQQLAFTNAGTQAVLSANSERINQLRGMLNDLGVQLDTQYDSMHKTIGLQQGEEQRVFENDETSKNNDVDRKVKISDVTGYAPDEWVASNNPYLNDDGTIKDEYKDVDFSAVMANAKASGNTKAYNEASVARYYKIMSNYAKYGKYDDGNYSVPGAMKTESARQFDEQTKLSDKELDTTKELTQAELEAQERMNNADNATTLEKTQREIESAEKLAQVEEDVTWEEALKGYDLSDNAKTLLGLEVYDAWANGEAVDVKSILEANKDEFKITLQDASEIARMFNLGKEVKQWIKEQTWYSKDDTNFTPE